jgi:hypothetical protein
MTATSQFFTARRSSTTSGRPILPKRSIPDSQTEAAAKTAGRVHAHVVWPILMIGLGVGLSLVWMTFLVWEAAITIATVVT